MKIGNIQKGNKISTEIKTSNNRDFSKSFNKERERKSKEELKIIINNIKKKGNRLVITKTYADVRIYKKMIKEYLDSIFKYMYQTKKDTSFWQTQYFVTVDTIDSKLEELTSELINDQKENLDIASKIDEIQGLVLDIYR